MKEQRSRLLETDFHIGVVGCGLAGLSAALSVVRSLSGGGGARRGGRITVYERDRSPDDRREGYGMTLTYDPAGPLSRLGVLEDVARGDCPSRCHYLFDEKGGVMGYYGNAFRGEGDGRGAGQRGNLRIPRGELRDVLLRALREQDGDSIVAVEWGKRLRSYADRPMLERLDELRASGGGRKGAAGCTKSQADLHGVGDGSDGADDTRRPVLLYFEDGTSDSVDLLVGADGVNSTVARQYLSASAPFGKKRKESGGDADGEDDPDGDDGTRPQASPRRVGIFVVLGITDHLHPLIDERAYHTLDGTSRLFLMPFEGSRLDDLLAGGRERGSVPRRRRRRRTMWQLSFPADRDECSRLGRMSPEGLRDEVLRRCGDWHEPFPGMVESTPTGTVWGTALLDRDPRAFLDHRARLEVHGRLPSRVVLVGDAAHSMTPFKGQGANQALADGPLLASWLGKSKLDSAVRQFMNEMANRSRVKVLASREAAARLHSPDCWKWMRSQDGPRTKDPAESGGGAVFHGVGEDADLLLETLRRRGIGASLGGALDGSIRAVIEELGIAGGRSTGAGGRVGGGRTQDQLPALQSRSLACSGAGDVAGLRELSRRDHRAVPLARDAGGRSCLHLAAGAGHLELCKWLLSEAGLDCALLDADGRSALDLARSASEDADCEVVDLLVRWNQRVR